MTHRFYHLLLFFACACSVGAAEKNPQAVLVGSLKDYKNISAFKQDADEIFVHLDTANRLSYGMFEGDDQPQEVKPWNVYDILYTDVPAKYEMGLHLLGEGEYEKAQKMFLLSRQEKTPISKTSFSSTHTYKNHMNDKLLQCALGLGKKNEANKLFIKIRMNKNAHAYMRSMILFIAFLNENGEGKASLSLVDDLLKKGLSKKKIVSLKLQRCQAQASSGDFKGAKKALEDLVDEYSIAAPDLEEKAEVLLAEIIIKYEKNYRKGIEYYKKIMRKKGGKGTAEIYNKLGDCYANLRQYPEARWQYIQAYQSMVKSKNEVLSLIEKINAVNKKIRPQKGTEQMNRYFAKIKSFYEQSKK